MRPGCGNGRGGKRVKGQTEQPQRQGLWGSEYGGDRAGRGNVKMHLLKEGNRQYILCILSLFLA